MGFWAKVIQAVVSAVLALVGREYETHDQTKVQPRRPKLKRRLQDAIEKHQAGSR